METDKLWFNFGCVQIEKLLRQANMDIAQLWMQNSERNSDIELIKNIIHLQLVWGHGLGSDHLSMEKHWKRGFSKKHTTAYNVL